MKKKDIRRGTTITFCFALAVYAVITVFLWIHQPGGTPEDKRARAEAYGGAWADSLTNEKSDAPQLEPMESEIARFMGRWNIRGISLAVTRNDSLLYAKGLGMADAERGVRMTPNTIMRMASASKLVTAIAVMKLVEQGRLRLDERVLGEEGILDYPAITRAIRDPRLRDITVDHLLHHEGGFTLGAGDPMFNTKDIIAAKRLPAPPDSLRLVEIVMDRRLGFAPGTGRRYSNFGYMLLSLVIEKVTGMSYWDYVTQEVLNPAGIYRFRPATNYYAARNPDETRYYGPDNEKVEEWNGSGRMVERIYGGSNVHGLMGAGGWCASAAELARLVASADGDPKVPDVVGPASVAALTEFAPDKKLSRGWTSTDADGKWVRTGTLSSTHTLVERFPDGECWVLITNSGVWTGHRFTSDLTRLVDRLRSRYSAQFPARDLW